MNPDVLGGTVCATVEERSGSPLWEEVARRELRAFRVRYPRVRVVIVDRGWLPAGTPSPALPTAEVRIPGRLRQPDTGGTGQTAETGAEPVPIFRVDVNDIRRDSDKAVIEAAFDLDAPTAAAVKTLLEPEGLWEENGSLSPSREIRAGGRRVARVNGRSVSLSLQAELGALLADIHGQSEHLSLLKVRHHLDLLDRFAHHEDVLNAYTQIYRQWLALRSELQELLNLQQYAKDRTDMLKYQIQEIETARLKTNEEADLRQERTLLANAETLHSLSQQALSALDEGGEIPPVTDLRGQAQHALDELARIDPQMSAMSERADQALNTISEIAYELRGYLELSLIHI